MTERTALFKCQGCGENFEKDGLVHYMNKGRVKYRKHCPPCWSVKQRTYKQSEAGKRSTAKSAKSEKRKISNARFKKSAKRATWQEAYAKNDKVREKSRKNSANQRALHPDRVKMSFAKWYSKHGAVYAQQYCAKARKNPLTRIQVNIGNGIREMLRSYADVGRQYTSSKLSLTGLNSSDELKEHFASRFEKGMTWNNYGRNGWVNDHIIPQVMYDANDPADLARCWNYLNMRPCWDLDNSKKKDAMPSEELLALVPQELYPASWKGLSPYLSQ